MWKSNFDLKDRISTKSDDRLNEWFSDRVSEKVTEWVTDWVTDWVTEWVTEWVSEWVTVWVTEWVTDWLSDRLGEWLSRRVIEEINNWVNDIPLKSYVHTKHIRTDLSYLSTYSLEYYSNFILACKKFLTIHFTPQRNISESRKNQRALWIA